MRKALASIHRYVGLILGLLFALLGLTGSVLVFDHAIDARLNPEWLLSQPTELRLPLSQVLAAAQAAAPAGARAARIDLPQRVDGVHTVRFNGIGGELLEITVDPYTGKVTSAREWGAQGMSWIYRLHYTLLGGNAGKTVVGLSGIALLLISLVGLYLWWPRQGRWRSVLKLRLHRGALPLNNDLHRWIGVLAAPLLVVVSFSGIYIVFAGSFQAVSDRLFPPMAQSIPTLAPSAIEQLDLDAVVALAERIYPRGEPKRVFLPKGNEAYRVTLRQPGEPRSGGLSDVWLSQDGHITQVRDYASSNHGQRFLAWMFPLHNGEAFGLAGRLTVAAVGVVPAALFITGFLLWLLKRRQRQASHRD